MKEASLKGKPERAGDNKYCEMWNILVHRFHFSHDKRLTRRFGLTKMFIRTQAAEVLERKTIILVRSSGPFKC